MALLDTIHRQADFPKVDLTDANAELLSLILGNPGILRNGHAAAEKTYPLFSATHRSLAIAAEHMFDAPENNRAVEYGIKTLEAMTLFVAADALKPEFSVLKKNFSAITKPSNTGSVREYFERVTAEFLDETPNAANVISESSSRFLGDRATLAVVGGAVARQFGFDNAK